MISWEDRSTVVLFGDAAGAVVMAPEAGRTLKHERIVGGTRPDYVDRHQWRRHDLVLWDNRCALHRAANIPERERRLMHRTTVAGVGPVS